MKSNSLFPNQHQRKTHGQLLHGASVITVWPFVLLIMYIESTFLV
jgi:hypothetical protein